MKPDTGPEVINETDKWLIFTTGNRTKIPHQVGIKRLSNVRFKQHMDLSKGIEERVAERKRKARAENRRLDGKYTMGSIFREQIIFGIAAHMSVD